MLVRRVARPMLASIFVSGGITTLRNPEGPAAMAEDVATGVAEAVPADLPEDPVTLVRIDAAVKVVGGLLLAKGGRTARLGALACAVSLVPTTIAGHPFWSEDDADVRAQQQIHFFKNVSLLGGLLLAAVDTGGKPSLGWRARHVAADLREQAVVVGHKAQSALPGT